MTRRRFTIASVLSLVLCGLTAVLWVRSYWMADVICWDRGQLSPPNPRQTQLGLRSQCGRLEYGFLEYPPESGAWSVDDWFGGPCTSTLTCRHTPAAITWRSSESVWNRLGFRAQRSVFGTFSGVILMNRMNDLSVYTIPYWSLTAFFMVLPLSRVAAGTWTRRRQELGLCIACGYDLRASPERCPECGTSVSGKVPVRKPMA